MDSDPICCPRTFFFPHSPGRFFAANELKAMLAYIVVHYDLKVTGADPAARPPNVYFANTVLPNPKGQVLFRKRQPAVPVPVPSESVPSPAA